MPLPLNVVPVPAESDAIAKIKYSRVRGNSFWEQNETEVTIMISKRRKKK